MTEGNFWGCGKMHALDWLFFLGYVPFLELRFMLKLSNGTRSFVRFEQGRSRSTSPQTLKNVPTSPNRPWVPGAANTTDVCISSQSISFSSSEIYIFIYLKYIYFSLISILSTFLFCNCFRLEQEAVLRNTASLTSRQLRTDLSSGCRQVFLWTSWSSGESPCWGLSLSLLKSQFRTVFSCFAAGNGGADHSFWTPVVCMSFFFFYFTVGDLQRDPWFRVLFCACWWIE